MPTRWIDQGAIKAIEFVEVPNRYLAGITEVALKEHIADKTNWRKMLQGSDEEVDLASIKQQLSQYIPEEVKQYFVKEEVKITELNYPVIQNPEKVKSLSLLKTPSYTGVLKGIKGQYLIFEDNTVFNVRANEGLVVTINTQ